VVVLGWRFIGTQIDLQVLQTFFRTGLPLLPVSVAGWVLLYADRWLLAPQVPPLALGQYALAVLLASLLAFVIEPLKNAWQPIALRMQRDGADRFLALSFRIYGAVALLLVGGLVIVAPTLLWVIGGADAHGAVPYVLPLASMPVLGGVQMLLGIRAVQQSRTRVFGASGVSAAIGNLGLNLLLIPRYGVMGAACATAAAALIGTLVLALAEPQTTRVMRVWAELWLVVLWVGSLVWWGIAGPSWGTGAVLLCLAVLTIVRAWPALRQWQAMSSSIEP